MCKCQQCFGLAEYMLQATGDDHGLPRATGHALRVLTFDPDQPDTTSVPCAGTMTCECPDCQQDRAARVASGVRDIRQPWEARRAA